MVSVMKLEKAPKETYADIGGLDAQIQEIKVNPPFVFLLLKYQYTHPMGNAYFSLNDAGSCRTAAHTS